MTKNIGDLDALLRMWTGSYIFGRGISKRSLFMTTLGGLIISEALTRTCLAYSILGISTADNYNNIMEGNVQGSFTGKITSE